MADYYDLREYTATAERCNLRARVSALLIIVVLRRLQSFTLSGIPPEEDNRRIREAMSRVWDGLRRGFGVQRSTAHQLDTIIEKYRGVRQLLGGDVCLISRVPGDRWDDYLAGCTPCRPGGTYLYGIYLGRAFFEPTGDEREVIRTYYNDDNDLWRAGVLIHEAVHWVNRPQSSACVPRRSEADDPDEYEFNVHCGMGPLHDPYSYEFFVSEFHGHRSLIELYRRDCPVTAIRPTSSIRVADSRGVFRSRRTHGVS